MDVSLGGRVVDPVSLSVEREFSDSLPGGGSFTAASGEVSYVPGPDVSSRVATPWDPAPGVPMAEESVSVSMDVGLGPVSVLPQGRVSDTSAGTGSRVTSVGFTDLYRSLDRDITWDGMAARMPAEGDAAYWRNPGLFGVSVVDRIFRHCGWYATPPMDSGALVSVPMQGSAWAERGKVTRAERLSVPGAAPGWITSPWGMVATDLNLTYDPSRSRALSSGAFEITAMLPPSSGTARVVCWFGGRRIQLTWTDASVLVSAETGANSFTQLVSLSRTPDATAVTARITRRGAGLVQAAMRTNAGTFETGTDVSMPDTYLTAPMSHVTVYGGGRCGAFQVAQSTAWLADGWKPSAAIRARAGIPNRLRVLPPVIGGNCASMLQDLARAEYATFWIDEKGVMQWWDIDRLESQLNVATLTTADHVTRLEWSQDLSSVYRRAVVTWKSTLLDVSFRNRITLWRGRGETVTAGSGEVAEEIIQPPSDEVWLMPDLTLGKLNFEGSGYNLGVGSWFGGVWEQTDSWAEALTVTAEKIVGDTLKVTTSTSTGGTVGSILQRTPSPGATSWVWAGRRNDDLPVVRGKMKYTLLDEATPSSQSGPSMAPEFAVDTGWWIQYADEAQWLADKYGSRVTVPSPELGEVGIKPFPGLQLGDKVTISAPDVAGLSIQGIVYADSRSISAGSGFSMEHTIRVRPISVSRDSGVTWEEWRASIAASMTHTQWAGTQSGKTWTQWGTAPVS